jgi:hydrogenase maturation protein HypF
VKDEKNWLDYKRYQIKIYGIVQGVGFRPFVYNKALKYKVDGWVINEGGAVVIDCSGTKGDIKRFIFDIVKHPPTLAKLEKIICIPINIRFETVEQNTIGFKIKESINIRNKIRFVSPDVATCDKCLADIQQKGSSRYKYPFTNCTECGPRYSIIKDLPYDRPYTTMESFYMCEECKKEYDDPSNRRFHAEPNCCAICGPKLYLIDNKGQEIENIDAIEVTAKLIQDGKIIAIKGIGGFHLVCDARNEDTIQMLRTKKQRKDKPLALMAKNIDIVKEICNITKKEEEILLSNRKPIVILTKKIPSYLPDSIAPGLRKLGLMLPYTPLQHLLFEEKLDLLVVTSGNISGMPIEYKNEDAKKNLSDVADYFLLNDRDIYTPSDDSVVKVINGVELVSRRARGYTPYAVKVQGDQTIIALGAEQKSSICVSKNQYAYVSQYLGDLEDYSCYLNYQKVLNHYVHLFDISAEMVVHDMHPNYISTYFAKSQTATKIAVWHHHAHMVSCMAEHSISDNVIGVIYDGTGLGLDGAVWGGEFLIGNRKNFYRVGHLEYVFIQGGDQAIKEPWRCAASYLNALSYDPVEIIKGVDSEVIKGVNQALNSKINCFLTSSIGRLFDAVAALSGIRNKITYDGQAAIELENVIDLEVKDSYKWNLIERDEQFLIQYQGIIEGVLEDVNNDVKVNIISTKFHNTIIDATCSFVYKIRELKGLNKVVLSGGVFENSYLLTNIYNILKLKNFEVFYNQQIPTNDGGISFGQINIAIAAMENEI